MTKLCLLGHGPFAKPAFDMLGKKYPIVSQDQANCLIVANYGKILTQLELDRPRYGAINLHGSYLPSYRGASPIQTAIANGDKETGVTIITMDSKVDHGQVIAQEKTPIKPTDTTESLKHTLGVLAARLLEKHLDDYILGKIVAQEQDHSQATFTKKLVFEDGQISADMSANDIFNRVRAYNPEPGAYIKLVDNQILKILTGRLENDQFEPLIVQKSGKKPMPYADFLLGHKGKPLF